MPRPSRPWFRVYVEMFPDRKIRRLTPAQRWIWVALMGAARESPKSPALYVADDLPMTHREMADYADVKEREIAPALAAMQRLGMVAVDGDVVSLPNFTSRQFESDDVTKRTRAHRERSKTDNKERSIERSNVVPGNAPETETETETEKPSPRPRGEVTSLRPRDELWDAIVAACRIDPESLTKTAASLIGKVRRELAEVGATPQEVHARARRWHRIYENAELTPPALAKHWAALAERQPEPRHHDPLSSARPR